MVKERVERLAQLPKQIEDANANLLREMVKAVTGVLMHAEVSAVCGAPYRQSSINRVNRCNGYRERQDQILNHKLLI